MDVVGQVSPQLSTGGQLRLMQWVGGYQQTLRGLGVQEVRRFVEGFWVRGQSLESKLAWV